MGGGKLLGKEASIKAAVLFFVPLPNLSPVHSARQGGVRSQDCHVV